LTKHIWWYKESPAGKVSVQNFKNLKLKPIHGLMKVLSTNKMHGCTYYNYSEIAEQFELKRHELRPLTVTKYASLF